MPLSQPRCLLCSLLIAFSLTSATVQAAERFELSEYPGHVKGTPALGNFKLITNGGAVECANTFSEELTQGVTTLELTISYAEQGCKAFGFSEPTQVTVKPEGCSFLLHPTEQILGNKYRAHMDLQCPTGKTIKVTAAFCALEVKPQSSLTTVTFSNAAGSEEVVIDPEVTSLNYTVTKDGFGCPLKGVASYSDGELTSSGITLWGHKWANPEATLPFVFN